jgi:hypothetical protein
MKSKQSLRRGPRLCGIRPSRRPALMLLAIAASGLAYDARPALAVTLPPWMQAQVSAPIPEHDDETDAVLLYSDTALTVQANGKIVRLERSVYRILRAAGTARSVIRADFDSQSRVTRMHGWSVPPQGKPYEVSERDAVETALLGAVNGELMGDVRSRVLRIPAGVPGSLIGSEVEEELQPYVLADEWGFQDTVPVREAHYSLELPPGWQYKATWINHADQAPAAVGATHWQWAVSDVKAIKPEEQMPPRQAISGRLAISLLPPAGRGQGFQTWSELGTWYLDLTRDRRASSPAIKQKASELTASESTLLGKIQALARFVQTDVRYVAIELGIGGLQPHTATDVFTHHYGDCKDKVTLLSTMLKEIGVDSHYFIVNTKRGAITESTPANIGFDHVILAIQVPSSLQDPTLLAVLRHAKLSRLLLFDPTDAYTPLGRLAGPLQGGFGLLVAPDGGELTQLPVLPADSSAIQRTAHLSLDENGQLSGEVHEAHIGDMGSIERGVVDSSTQETDKAKSLESLMAGSFSTFQLMRAAVVNLHAPAQPLEWNYIIEADHYAKVSGELLMVRPRVLGSKSSGLLETRTPRQYDIEFEGPRRDTDVFEIIVPSGYTLDELPPPLDEDLDFASYHSKTEFTGRTLRYTRSFEVKSVSVPVAKALELRDFYRRINNDERLTAIFRHTSP